MKKMDYPNFDILNESENISTFLINQNKYIHK